MRFVRVAAACGNVRPAASRPAGRGRRPALLPATYAFQCTRSRAPMPPSSTMNLQPVAGGLLGSLLACWRLAACSAVRHALPDDLQWRTACGVPPLALGPLGTRRGYGMTRQGVLAGKPFDDGRSTIRCAQSRIFRQHFCHNSPLTSRFEGKSARSGPLLPRLMPESGPSCQSWSSASNCHAGQLARRHVGQAPQPSAAAGSLLAEKPHHPYQCVSINIEPTPVQVTV